MRCPRCQQENPSHAEFCLKCGTPVTGAAPLKSYADLKDENEALGRSLTEALDRETATGAILRVISSSPTDIQPVLETVAESAARLCDSRDASIFRLDGDRLLLVAHYGPMPSASTGEFSIPLVRGTVSGRSVLDGRTVQVADPQKEANEFPESSENARRMGHRTILSVPLIREGVAIGAINLRRTEAQLFTERQVALLQTFAAQAVIAIENVRLFKELQEKNQALTQAHAQVTESLDQQTATSEVLRVISSSPTDVQPVFEAIARSAKELCEAEFSTVFRFDGSLLHFAAHCGWSPAGVDALRREFPTVPHRRSAGGRAILSGTVEHIPDVYADQEYALGAVGDFLRSTVAVPMLHDGVAIGTINVNRSRPGPFSDRQIALLKTFADQAVIAIENVRLFKELQQKNEALTAAHAQVSESLEQQTATGEILRVIASSPTDAQPVFDVIARNAVALCDGFFSLVGVSDGRFVHLRASHNLPEEWANQARAVYPLLLSSEVATAKVIREQRVLHVLDVQKDAASDASRQRARTAGYRTWLGVPLLAPGGAIGVLAVARREKAAFTDKQIALLQTFADQAVIAIENVRLFKELQEKNQALTQAHAQVTESLEQQTATSEILRAISNSPTDVRPTFEAIAASAAKLCEAGDSAVFLFEAGLIHLMAHYDPSGTRTDVIRQMFPMPPGRGSVTARAILTRTVVHIPDIADDPEYEQSAVVKAGFRSVLSVPILRDDQPIGALTVSRRGVKPFSSAQLALLQTFADQALIAIENVRLFTELQARTQELTRSVGQLTALGEVGRAVSSTLDLETVLTTIVSRAVQLADLEAGAIYEYDEAAEVFHLRATQNLPEEFLQIARPLALPKGEGATGRLAVTREPVQIPDITAPDAYHGRMRDVLLRMGHRALLAVPLISEDHIVGGLVVNRRQPGEFAPEVIELLRTFATQSTLAIQNAPPLPGDRGQESPAGGRQPAQVRVPGQHVPRAADAPERDHRFLRGPDRPHVR